MKALRIVRKTLFFWSFVGMMMFVSCTDITDLIGSDFVLEESNMHLKMDTVTLETYSILSDSVATSISETHLFGSINDEFFGKVNAGLYAQFLISAGFDSVYHEAEFFDSVILSLAYSGDLYGDILAEHTIRIYELNENLPDTFVYYSNETFEHNLTEIASLTFTPKTTYIDPTDTTNQEVLNFPIRINITDLASHSIPVSAFIDKLKAIRIEDYLEYDEVSESNIINHVDFYDYFKGLYIETDQVTGGSAGSLVGLSLYSEDSYLKLYKHDEEVLSTSNGDTTIIINSVSSLNVSTINGTSFNNFNHFDYVDADMAFQDQVLSDDKDLGKEELYVQSLGGTHIRIKFPFIKNLNDLGSKIAVNKAELVLSVSDNITPTFFETPPQLTAKVQFGSDSSSFIPDIAYGSDYFGGVLDTSANEYRFRVTRYIQEVLDGLNEGEDGLFIYSSPDHNAYFRTMLIGSDPSLPTPFSKRARLEIRYTVID